MIEIKKVEIDETEFKALVRSHVPQLPLECPGFGVACRGEKVVVSWLEDETKPAAAEPAFEQAEEYD